MFISLSKTIARFGGFRLGFGIRFNKKNSIWLSLLMMIVAMFQLMWYLLILCGWIIYAIFYGMYWCIKKIVCAISKKPGKEQIQNTIKITQDERKDDYSNMTPNENNNKSPKKISTIIRYIASGFFLIFALVNGVHYSSLFFICAAVLMFPLPFTENFMQKKNINKAVAVTLSVVLFFAGTLTSPISDTADSSEDTEQTTSSDTEDTENITTEADIVIAETEAVTTETEAVTSETEAETTETESVTTDTEAVTTETEAVTTETEAETTETESVTTDTEAVTTETEAVTTETEAETTETEAVTTETEAVTTETEAVTTYDENTEMVWIPSTGQRYHSSSTCSNMDSPTQVPIEEAIERGYTACKRCH